MRSTIISSIKQGIRDTIKIVASALVFDWPGVKTLVPTTGTTPTFTRATSATFEDFEGLIKTADSSEPRFVGARRVENLSALSPNGNSEDLTGWTVYGTGTRTLDTVDYPAGTSYSTQIVSDSTYDGAQFSGLTIGNTYVASAWVKGATGGERFWINDHVASAGLLTSTDQWVRYTQTWTATSAIFALGLVSAFETINFSGVMVEDVTGQANQNPSDYVSTGVGTGSELITNGDFATDVSGWTALSSTLTWDTGRLKHQADVNSTNAYAYQIVPTVVGKTYSLSFDTTAGTFLTTGTSYKLGTSVGSVVNGSGVITLGSTTTAVFVATATSTYIQFVGYTSSAPKYFFVDNVSVKEASHGANIDGVQYFDTLNGNTVSSNVVTAATGALIGASNENADAGGPFGYLSEKASTNLCLYSAEFDNAAWATSNVTVTADDATGPSGTVTADLLTATAGNGTVIQNLGTIASAIKTGSLWVKRKTGTGAIELTLDAGATWTGITVTAGWTRVEMSQTLADPDFGIRIVTSADAVWVEAGQVEVSSYPTSYIATAAASVTRNADVLTAGDMVTDAAGTAYAEASSIWATVGPSAVHVLTRGSATLLRNVNSSSNIIWTGDGTNTSFSPTGTSYQNAPQSVASTWGSALTAYLNGSPDLTPAAYDGTMGTGNLEIGMLSSTSQWDGTIRHVKIFDSELTAAEVADL